jgi:membrane-associated phospholipid phosphatase
MHALRSAREVAILAIARRALGAGVAIVSGMLAVLGSPASAFAQVPPRPAAPQDSLRVPPVVTWRDVGLLASGAALTMFVHPSDLAARREVRSRGWQDNAVLDAFSEVGNPWGDPGTMIAGMGLWLGGRAARRPTMAAAGFRAIEAITVSGWITQTLKDAIGRARPRVTPDDAWDVEFWRGHGSLNGDYESMPSGHSTAAFAFAAAVTSELAHRNDPRTALVGVTTYSLAAMTAYARMHRDAHWLSDVTMGATIGIVSAHAITRWHATRPGNRLDRWALGASAAPLIAPGAQGSTRIGATIAWP